jgi:hypothetical protein
MFATKEEEIYLLVKYFETQMLRREDWNTPVQVAIGTYYCYFHTPAVAEAKMLRNVQQLRRAHGVHGPTPAAYDPFVIIKMLQDIGRYLKANDFESDITKLVNGLVNELDCRRYKTRPAFSSRDGVSAKTLFLRPIEAG